MPLIKLEAFAPDADNTAAGIAVEMSSMVPTLRGYKAAPTASDPGIDALSAACLGAVVVRKLDNSRRIIAGTATKLYELSGSTWSDVSASSYNAATDRRWTFAQFGDVTVAANKGDTLQFSSSGAFAAIASAPKAKLVETVNQFVIVADTNDTGFGDSPDRWWCSAIGDYTDWTPDTATQCVSGRLTSSPGPITALRRLGDGIIAYKDRAMFAGSYVGAPEAWSFQEIPGKVGCPAQGAVVDIGVAHVFPGYDNFYRFDGSRPVEIGNPIKNWFFSRLFMEYAYRMKSVHDRANSNIYFFYPSTAGAGALDSCVVYNYRVDKWGVDDRTVEDVVDYISAGITWAGSYATGTTWAEAESGLTWDSPLLVSGQPAPAFIDTSHDVYLLTGAGDAWSFTTNDFGDDIEVTSLIGVRPRFLTSPTTAQLINYYRMQIGDALTTDATTTYGSGRFDFLRDASWHRFRVSGTGGVEVSGLNLLADNGGAE